MFFTSKQTSAMTGCTLRQLQYWREQKIIVPTVDATGKGRSVFYTEVDLVALMIMKKFLSSGLDYTQACIGLNAIREQQPNFTDPNIKNRYFFSDSSSGNSIALKEFNVTQIETVLKLGQPIIPIWLDAIHSELAKILSQYQEEDTDKKQIKPELEITKIRECIDEKLKLLGWKVINYQKDLEISQLTNHAVKEYLVATGIAEYTLFVNGLLLGVIEVDKLIESSKSNLGKAKKYSQGAFDGISNWRGYRVPFLYSSNRDLVFFLDVRKRSNIPYQIANFHTPEALNELLKPQRNKSLI